MGFFNKIFNYIAKASRPIFKYENDKLKFLLNSDEYFDFTISDLIKKTRHSSHTLDAYTLLNNDIFLESVILNSNSTWSGQARSLYENFLKSELKLKSLNILNREDIGNYEFTTYKVNDSFILHLIYIWNSNQNIFIIDTNGKLFSTLLSQLKENYSYKYQDELKSEINFDISIVKSDILGEYFQSNN
jgi:hypothetical protein